MSVGPGIVCDMSVCYFHDADEVKTDLRHQIAWFLFMITKVEALGWQLEICGILLFTLCNIIIERKSVEGDRGTNLIGNAAAAVVYQRHCTGNDLRKN